MEATEIKKVETGAVVEAAPTNEGVLAKVKAGETLTEKETEFFKSLPKDEIPAPTAPAAAKPAAEAAKPAETAVGAPTEAMTDARRALIAQEVEKPRELQDLTKYSQAELSLYWELKKSRNKNQKLQEELEIERVQGIVKDLKAKEAKPAEAVAAAEAAGVDPMKVLEGMDDDDIMTAGQARKLIEALKAPKAPEKPVPTQLRTSEQIKIERIEADQVLRAKGVTDFQDVIDHAAAALGNDPDAAEHLRAVAREGGNVVVETYWLIKGSKAWPELEKTIKAGKGAGGTAPSKENLDKANKIEENASKIRTTGAATGAAANAGEYTLEEIKSMTPSEVRRLPKETRQAILKKYGSNPNFSV